MKKRVVRISKDGTITSLHADEIDFESLGDVKIERATDVFYTQGIGWRARCIHPAYKQVLLTPARRYRKDSIHDEEVVLNQALDTGRVNTEAL